jgi:hypothetical protein
MPEVQLYASIINRAINDIRIGARYSSESDSLVFAKKYHIDYKEVVSAIRYIFAAEEEKIILEHLSHIYPDNYHLAHSKLKEQAMKWISTDQRLFSRFHTLMSLK